jgi:hypothetical protein
MGHRIYPMTHAPDKGACAVQFPDVAPRSSRAVGPDPQSLSPALVVFSRQQQQLPHCLAPLQKDIPAVGRGAIME